MCAPCDSKPKRLPPLPQTLARTSLTSRPPLLHPAGDAKPQSGRIAELFVYDNFARTSVEEVSAGDICAFTGLSTVSIGETICDPADIRPLPTIEVRAAASCGSAAAGALAALQEGMCVVPNSCAMPCRALHPHAARLPCPCSSSPPYPTHLLLQVEEPTVRMTFSVNTSPFAGQEGKFVTSRNLKDRLERELERNLALRVDPGAGAESFEVSGRG